MSDTVTRFFEVYELVGQITMVLYVLLYDDSTTEDVFHYTPAWCKTSSFFCQQFLSLGLESVGDN